MEVTRRISRLTDRFIGCDERFFGSFSLSPSFFLSYREIESKRNYYSRWNSLKMYLSRIVRSQVEG